MITTLAPCFTGNLVWFGERIALAKDCKPSLTGTQLLEPQTARHIIGEFAKGYPGCDRRALVSLWTQWYFAALVIPSVAAVVRLGRVLPVEIGEIGVTLCQEGQPEAIVVRDDGAASVRDATVLFRKLFAENIDPLICSWSQMFAVTPRLLWSNAAVVFEWALSQAETGPIFDSHSLTEGWCLLNTRLNAEGLVNPLHEPVRYVTEDGMCVRRRRVCCLRYLLVGEEHCGSLCPIPTIWKSA